MKKIVLNISESTFEKFRLEAIRDKKNIKEIIEERIYYKPFSDEVEDAYLIYIEMEINKIFEEE